ncbi:ATP-binding cassette domain-containing protein [Streptococcus parasuis]|jgi:putative ABC transport system ATP-binding protein|uniref:ATP-binding cassette domain-containing protein n=1 Tax=Streptococcus parasuis TaxID=1501662 RepID=UPI00289C895E|nr:ATP-binding cassette domain-containing protein [Streptococcus parasuis]
MEAIKINHLTKKFGDRIVFENLNLEIPERSIISIVGKSGSGKSTLLNMIGLLEDFEIGSIELFGNTLPKINSSKATQIRRNKISYLFQSYALINDMTVTQNLLLSLHFTDLSTNEKKNKLDLVLDELELNHLKKSKINTLSGGEQQRVALARAILKPSQLILCDEPTGALDHQLASKIYDNIELLRDEYNKTVLIVTHDLELAQKTDKVIDISTL